MKQRTSNATLPLKDTPIGTLTKQANRLLKMPDSELTDEIAKEYDASFGYFEDD